MPTSRKVMRWDGPNKRRARSRKIAMVCQAQSAGYLSKKPKALTFAGARAHFERGLMRRGAVSPEDIVTIQTCKSLGSHDTASILHKLIDLRDTDLPGMMIWPYDFADFCKGYKSSDVYIPSFSGTPHAWYKTKKFRKEMLAFLDHKPVQFDIVDADICGTFSEATGGQISTLMANHRLADSGLLFINHMKGRDGRWGKLFEFLREYYYYCPYFDVDGLEDEEGNKLDLNVEDELSFWFVRYNLVPIYYLCEAFEAGYLLTVERLVEYRDRNESSRAGVNMLQWYFRFNKLPSEKLRNEGSIQKYQEALKQDKKTLAAQIDLVSRSAYPYTDHID